MPERIWSEDLNRYVEFPDGTSRPEMERLIREYMDEQPPKDDGVDVGASIGHGLKTGFADLVDSAADYSQFGELLSPVGAMNKIGQSFGAPNISWGADLLRDKARNYAVSVQESANNEFVPEGYKEKVLSGVASAPGTLVGMAPALAATYLAAHAVGPFAPAIGFGLHGAVRGVDQGPEAMAVGGAMGAAEGLAFGGLGKAVSPLKSALLKRALHGAGASAIGGGSTAAHGALSGHPAGLEDIAAGSTVMGVLGLSGVGGKRKTGREIIDDALRRKGIEPTDVGKGSIREEVINNELAKRGEGPIGDPTASPVTSETKDGYSFVDLAAIREAKGDVKPPSTRTNYEKVNSPLAIDEIGWRELQGMAPEKQTKTLSEMIDRASDIGDYEAAADIFTRFAAEYGEGRLAGIAARTKSLSTNYNRLAAGKRLELDKAEAAGDVQAVQQLSSEYADLSRKGMALVGMDSKYGTEAARDMRIRREAASKETATDATLQEAARLDMLDAEMYDRIIRAQSQAERDALIGARYNPKLQDKIHEAWIMGMLSNPLTWAVNFTSNAAKIPLRFSSEATATAIDAGASLFTGKRTKTTRDFLAREYGLIKALPSVWQGAKEFMAWKTYLNDLSSPLNYSGKLETHGPKIGAGAGAGPASVAAGSLIRSSGRTLQIGDNIFRTIAEMEEVHAMASERAGKSATMRDISRMAKELLADPEKSEADLLRIQKAGDRAVFTEPLKNQKGAIPWFGGLIQEVKSGKYDDVTRGAKWGARVLFPFSRTPTNIIIDSLRHSPFGAIELARMVKSGASQRDIVSQLGSMAVGSAVMGIVASFAADGKITGGGPSDPKAYSAWRVNHQPYSFKIGDGDDSVWVSYQRIEPFASIFGIAADAAETVTAPPGEDKIGRAMSAIKDNLANKTYMLGMENLTKAWSDPKRYGQNWFESMASSLIPAFSGAIARAGDPVNRRQEGVVDAIKGRIPGLRQTLEPQYSLTGDVSVRDRPILNAVSPFNVTDVKPDRLIEDEIAKLSQMGYSIRGLPRRTKRISTGPGTSAEEMTPEEYKILMDWTKKASETLYPIMSAPSWEKLEPETKVKIINAMFDKFREPGHYQVRTAMRKRLNP